MYILHFPTCILADASWPTYFENIVAKGEIAHNEQFYFNCHKQNSITFKINAFIFRDFSNLFLDTFQVVCCTFAVCGKGLKGPSHKLFGKKIHTMKTITIITWSYILTLSHIQQICSRLFFKHLFKNVKNLQLLNRVEYIVTNVDIDHHEQFHICLNVFKSHLLQRRQKVSVFGKGLKHVFNISIKKSSIIEKS